MERGVLGGTYLGFKLVETDLCTVAKCHLIDTRVVSRDVTTQPLWDKLGEGAMCTIRYGLGTLRPDVIARITNC